MLDIFGFFVLSMALIVVLSMIVWGHYRAARFSKMLCHRMFPMDYPATKDPGVFKLLFITIVLLVLTAFTGYVVVTR